MRSSVKLGGLLGALLCIAAPPAGASTVPTPMETGCNASMQRVSVSSLVSAGYLPAPSVDVNQNGFICVRPVNPVVQERVCPDCPVPVLYYWVDDTLTPAFTG